MHFIFDSLFISFSFSFLSKQNVTEGCQHWACFILPRAPNLLPKSLFNPLKWWRLWNNHSIFYKLLANQKAIIYWHQMRAKRLKCRKNEVQLQVRSTPEGNLNMLWTQEKKRKVHCKALHNYTCTLILKIRIWRSRIRTLAIPPPKLVCEIEDWGELNRGSVTDLWARVSAEHWSRAGEAQHNRWITNARTGAPPLHTNVPKQ